MLGVVQPGATKSSVKPPLACGLGLGLGYLVRLSRRDACTPAQQPRLARHTRRYQRWYFPTRPALATLESCSYSYGECYDELGCSTTEPDGSRTCDDLRDLPNNQNHLWRANSPCDRRAVIAASSSPDSACWRCADPRRWRKNWPSGAASKLLEWAKEKELATRLQPFA